MNYLRERGNLEHTHGVKGIINTLQYCCISVFVKSINRITCCKLLHAFKIIRGTFSAGGREASQSFYPCRTLSASLFFYPLGSPPISAICLFLQRHSHTSLFLFILTFLCLFALHLIKWSWQGEIEDSRVRAKMTKRCSVPFFEFCLLCSSVNMQHMFMQFLIMWFAEMAHSICSN